jgi:glycerol-3-phosphate dehydrogenase (NAD(P)+)
MSTSKPRVAILGGGSFGTVIANLAASNGCHTTQWLRDAELVAEMQATHQNTRLFKRL